MSNERIMQAYTTLEKKCMKLSLYRNARTSANERHYLAERMHRLHNHCAPLSLSLHTHVWLAATTLVPNPERSGT